MKKKALFLDRDGVILNDENCYYIYKPEHYKINKEIIENLALISGKGYIFIVISNQSGIAKGLYSKCDTDQINKMLQNDLQKHGISVTEFYYCTHHPDIENCFCRKPGSLLIEKAIARFGIDRTKSFFIGDNNSDIEAAAAAGLSPYRIRSNEDITSVCRQIIQISS